MATRCRVGILNEDLSVKSMYVHWDGYPEHTGKVLNRYYVEPETVQNLVDGGYLSSIGDARPGAREPFTLRNIPHEDQALHHALNAWPDSGQDFEYCFNPREGSWAFRKTYGADTAWKSLKHYLNPALGGENVE
jgi:hypothetical protein